MISFLSDLIFIVLCIINSILFFICLFSEKHIAVLIDMFLAFYLSFYKDLVYGFIKACLEFITSGEFIFDISAKAFALSLFKTGGFLALALLVFYIFATLLSNDRN